MALTPPSGEDRSTRRGIGSLPESTEIATFVPVRSDDPRYAEALSDYVRIYEEQGPRAAFEATGFYSGPATGGMVVREISDANATINDEFFRDREEGPTFGDKLRYLYQSAVGETAPTTPTVSDILNHPELFEEVPEIADLPIYVEDMGRNVGGAYYPETGDVVLSRGMSPIFEKSVLFHEAAGHGVQDATGMPLGGSPNFEGRLIIDALRRQYPGYGEQQYETDLARGMERDLANATKSVEAWEKAAEESPENFGSFASQTRAREARLQADLDEQIQRILASDDPIYPVLPINPDAPDAEFQVYQALPGEVMARLIEARQLMQQPALEAMYPGDMLDVPEERIRFVNEQLRRLFSPPRYDGP